MTRLNKFLAKIAGMYAGELEPQTETEYFLNAIASGGGGSGYKKVRRTVFDGDVTFMAEEQDGYDPSYGTLIPANLGGTLTSPVGTKVYVSLKNDSLPSATGTVEDECNYDGTIFDGSHCVVVPDLAGFVLICSEGLLLEPGWHARIVVESIEVTPEFATAVLYAATGSLHGGIGEDQ